MNSTLHTEPVSVVLQRLLTTEERHDPKAIAATGLDGYPAHLDASQRAEVFRDVYMSVSSSTGELLYLLARAAGARTAVEYGTSFGVSTIYLASAVRDNGGGMVVGTELQTDKAVAAQRNFDEAGVADLIELRVGDALQTLSDAPDAIDLLLLDGWPELALPVLQLLESRLRTGSLIIVDDVHRDWGSDVHGPLRAYLADPDNGYFSVELPTGDGILVCLRMS
ncbi:O-methyltransferase [Mycolicibacterium madagascariense]|uniref:O-methyltransferase n=1 Tax=Mycolicibacterium madagascariense TaxID=212765 RepID=A0A7I7X9C4_9MYCO|nr:class I SAM-dependent methyltransferase [Mycolicibacterium madagascariense]MCV7012917.1 class I SAM-dependent methyltransferase [Mycolicibacterium madagascariense]BBZ26164.1 O-methyltransferase [Mycolicibacterium madagascariense]